MNIADFKPGQSMSRAEFTPELQETLINSHFGIIKPAAPPVVQPGQRVISDEDFQTFESLRTVFSNPDVAQAAKDIILRETIGIPPVSAPVAPPVPQAPPPVQTPVPQTPPPVGTTQQAPQGTPTPPADPFQAWWAGVQNDGTQTQTPPAPAPTPQSANVTPTAVAPNPVAPMTPAPPQPTVDPADQFRLAVAEQLLKQGVNPNEYLPILDTMTPTEVAQLLVQARNRTAAPPPVNLAEQTQPTGPVRVSASVFSSAQDVDRFRI